VPRPSHRRPLIGRAGEFAVLEGLVRRVRRGGGLAVVEGDPGIGKTRLVEAALDVARDAELSVLAARARELESNWPFGPIVDLVGRERLERHLRTWDLGPDIEGERQFRVAETVLELLDELCTRGPVLVAVEDIQWADPSTIGVLARMAAGVERLPVALVVSARPAPRRSELERLLSLLVERGAERVQLGPLDGQSVEQLLGLLLDARPGDHLLRHVGRAAGNPLFVGELVDALAAAGAIVRSGGDAELASEDAAPTLPLTILHRLSFLEPELLDLLRLASVLGASFGAPDLSLLTGRPRSELVPSLLVAQRAGLLHDEGERLAFRHELVRDALYQDMPISVRRGLHSQLARALAQAGEAPERFAAHLLRGAQPGDERAVRAVVDAARDLVGRAPGAAVELYREALSLAADPTARRLELLPELAEALVAAGLLGEGEETCREALALGVDPYWAGRLRLQLMFLLLRQARAAQLVREGEAALATPGLEKRDRARLRALTSMAHVFRADVEPAMREAGAVLQTSDDGLARALATNTLAAEAHGRGAFTEAAELMAPIVRWVEQSGSRAAHDVRPHMMLSVMLILLDRFDDAHTTIQRARDASESLGIVLVLPALHFQLALLEFSRGRLDDALAELETRTQLVEESGVGWNLPAESLSALIALHRDDPLAAERHVTAAEAEAEAGAAPYGTDLMVIARSRLLAAGGDADAALEAVASTFEARAAAGLMGLLPLLGMELAHLAAGAGEQARARPVVRELARIAERNPGAASLEAYPLQARGLVDSDADAMLAALTLLRGTGRVLQAARAAEDAATVAGDARALLEEARSGYERCGATSDLARVDAALRRHGARRGVTGPRRRAAKGWEALTDTELKVVALVAERLTNPEIAARMFISRRTVQTHVSHALAKLGVSTRRELAAAAARHGGLRVRPNGVADAEPPNRLVEGC
jgi:DNA-binding CsgD family transcriptional regulator/tetratricopeptide (TPR) repeat protein